jgi:hypothetical protein
VENRATADVVQCTIAKTKYQGANRGSSAHPVAEAKMFPAQHRGPTQMVIVSLAYERFS